MTCMALGIGKIMAGSSKARVVKEPGGRRSIDSVKGGWVKRDETTGRFVEVKTETGTYRAKPESESAIKSASRDRYDALKRLADR